MKALPFSIPHLHLRIQWGHVAGNKSGGKQGTWEASEEAKGADGEAAAACT